MQINYRSMTDFRINIDQGEDFQCLLTNLQQRCTQLTSSKGVAALIARAGMLSLKGSSKTDITDLVHAYNHYESDFDDITYRSRKHIHIITPYRYYMDIIKADFFISHKLNFNSSDILHLGIFNLSLTSDDEFKVLIAAAREDLPKL